MGSWTGADKVATGLTREVLQNAWLREEQAILTPTHFVCHPRQYLPMLMVFYGMRWPVRDDLLPQREKGRSRRPLSLFGWSGRARASRHPE